MASRLKRAVLGGRDARRLLEEGLPGRARITGIRVHNETGDGEHPRFVDRYALAVEGAAGRTCGVQMQLIPRGNVRLGMEVAVRADGTDAVIDWAATCGGTSEGERLLAAGDIPPPGIIDDSLLALPRARKKYDRATATVVAVRPVDGRVGPSGDWDYEFVTADGRVTPRTIHQGPPQSGGPPFYATHLGEVGTVLPGWIKVGRLTTGAAVDWPAAAEARPGVGEAPQAIFIDSIEPGLQGVSGT